MRCLIKDLGKVSTGNTPSKSESDFYESNDIFFVKPDAISDSMITDITEASEYLSDKARKKARIVNEGAVFVTCIGSIGKVGIARNHEYAFNQQINAIETNEKVLPEYLAYCIFYNKKRLAAIANAPVVPIINKTQFENFEVVIADKLDTQRKQLATLNKVARLVLLRKQQLSALDTLIKARFVEMFGEPKSNPFGYEKVELKKSCTVITGNTPSRAIGEFYGDYIEWIKTDNIVSGLMNPTSATESLSETGMKVGRTVDKDAILMACIAGSVASIGRVCITNRKVAFNQQINAIIPRDYNVLFLYVLLQISKGYLVEEINMALKGILSKSKLEGKFFILPPMEKQNEFANFVQQVDKSKVVVQKALDEAQLLFGSLMQKYFG